MILIISKGYKDIEKKLQELLDKYNLQKLLKDISGLKWKTKSLYIKHANVKQAEWKGKDTALVDFERGAIPILVGAEHEFAHLLLRQNNWHNKGSIKEFLDKHPEYDVESKGKGYLIEHALVYVLQEKIDKIIGIGENNINLIRQWNNRWEWMFNISGCGELEKKIFLELRKKDKLNIIVDLEKILEKISGDKK